MVNPKRTTTSKYLAQNSFDQLAQRFNDLAKFEGNPWAYDSVPGRLEGKTSELKQLKAQHPDHVKLRDACKLEYERLRCYLRSFTIGKSLRYSRTATQRETGPGVHLLIWI
jgi:hypothetical protein